MYYNYSCYAAERLDHHACDTDKQSQKVSLYILFWKSNLCWKIKTAANVVVMVLVVESIKKNCAHTQKSYCPL